jgi:hypothetical protein
MGLVPRPGDQRWRNREGGEKWRFRWGPGFMSKFKSGQFDGSHGQKQSIDLGRQAEVLDLARIGSYDWLEVDVPISFLDMTR